MAKEEFDLEVGPRKVLRGMRMVVASGFKAAPGLTLLGLILPPLIALFSSVQALWLKLLADGVLGGDSSKALIAAALIGVSTAVYAIGGIGEAKIRVTLMERVGFELDRQMVEMVMGLPGIEHHERPAYLDRLQLLRQFQYLLGRFLSQVVTNLTWIVSTGTSIILLARIHPLLVFLVLGALPGTLLVPATQRRARKTEENNAERYRLSAHIFGLATTHGPSKELRVFNLEKELLKRHKETWDETYRESMRAQWVISALSLAGGVLPTFGLIAGVAFVAYLAATGAATPGDVLLTVAVAGNLSGQISEGVAHYSHALGTMRSIERFTWLQAYSENQQEIYKTTSSAPETIQEGMTFERVSFRYPEADDLVLEDIDLKLRPGSVVALVGENGAGKTTLVKLLCRFYEPTSGRIRVDDTDLSSIDPRKWRERVASGFQDYMNFEFLAQESVGVGDLASISEESRVLASLDRAGASELPRQLARGLQTQLGKGWHEGVDLSTGQWQKLALGRTLMREDPLLLILDEPTSGLDAESEYHLFERYAKASRTLTAASITVLVSHRFSTVRMADLIIVLDKGRIVESGSHEQLMAMEGSLYRELFSIQAKAYS